MRKVLAYLVCCSLIVAPIRRAEAVFPIPVIVGATLVFDSGAMAFGYAAATAAVAGGLALLSIKLKDSSGADAVTVRINPKAPQAVPSGWSAGAQAYSAPVPPSSATQGVTVSYCIDGNSAVSASGSFASIGACVAQISATLTASNAGSVTLTGSGAGTWTGNRYNAAGAFLWTIAGSFTTVSSCPSGYTVSGATCNLSNAAVVNKPSDNVAQYDGTGSTFDADAYDPDTSGVPANYIRSSDGKVITINSGTDKIVVTQNADASISLDQWKGRGDGTSDHVGLRVGPPNSGATNGGRVGTGAVNERVVGEGTSAGTTAASGGGTVNCVGCATEATQLQVKSAVEGIKNDGVKIKEEESVSASARSDASTKMTTTTTAHADHETKFSNVAGSGLGALGVPGLGDFSAPGAHEQGSVPGLFVQPASCSPVVSTWGSRSVSFDVCPVANFVKPILEWFLYGLTVLYVYGAFWRRPQEVA